MFLSTSLTLFGKSLAGDRVMAAGPEGASHLGPRTDTWEGTVVEKEALALGSRSLGQQDLSKAARQANRGEPPGSQIRHLGVEPLMRASRANLTRPVWGSEESVSLASDNYGSTFSLYKGRTFSIPL